MKSPPRFSRLLAALLGLCCALPLSAFAATAQAATQRAAPAALAATSAGHVTIIVLDMSGSMAQNDPAGIRCSATNAYIDLSGPGDLVGVVDLDNSDGSTGGPHSFDLASVIAQPTDMSTLASRQHLRDQLQTVTHGCQPDANTPTYDALNKALGMLTQATKGGQIPGSVILLTDGDPEPNADGQIAAIKSDLVPQFKSHGWPIDTIALGNDPSFHGFLNDISTATSGNFYDDSQGPVPNVSPLNIGPFFVNIFSIRNGRTPGPTIAPTTLSGGAISRNFQLGQYVDHLDVIVVKDQPQTTVTVDVPNGQQLSSGIAGTFISTDPHYAIFSVDGPQSGTWQVNVTGSGQFLVDSLVSSSLLVSILAPTKQTPVQAIGAFVPIKASIEYRGATITGASFTVTGTLTYGGDTSGQAPYAQNITLSDGSSPGIYQAQVQLPNGAPTGTYLLVVNVTQVSDVPLSSAQLTLRFDLFPSPYFLTKPGGAITTAPVSATVLQFDPILQFIYGHAPGFLSWMGQSALQNHAPYPTANIPGEVALNNQPYCNATVRGTANPTGSSHAVPVTFVNGSCGTFQAQFPTGTSGGFTINFETSGTFQDSHGDFLPTARQVQLRVISASSGDEIHAWVLTALYLLLLIVLALLVRAYGFLPSPAAQFYTDSPDKPRQFAVNPISAWRVLFHRNVVQNPIQGIPGIEVRVTRSGRRTGAYFVRRLDDTPRGRQWRDDSNRELPVGQFAQVNGVRRNETTYHFLGTGVRDHGGRAPDSRRGRGSDRRETALVGAGSRRDAQRARDSRDRGRERDRDRDRRDRDRGRR